jgi:hypothetical protein
VKAVLLQVKMTHDNAETAIGIRIMAVQMARNDGCTWTEIGDALGISRQSAQKRFGQLVTEPDPKRVRAAKRLEAVANGDLRLPGDPTGPVDA